MASTGGDRENVTGTGTAECSATTIEIEIKRLDRVYRLTVDKDVPIPELKERITHVTGVPSDEQRLLCHRRLLEDHNLLSAYDVANGDIVYLIMRQQFAPPPERFYVQPPSPSKLLYSLLEIINILLEFSSCISRLIPPAGEQNDQGLDSRDSPSPRTPNIVASVIQSAVDVLHAETPKWLLLVQQIDFQANVTDQEERNMIEYYATVLGTIAQNLGVLCFKLGNVMLTLRMDPKPDDTSVPAGPSDNVHPRRADGDQNLLIKPWPLQIGSGYSNSPTHILHPSVPSSRRASSGQVLESSRISEDSTVQPPQNTGSAPSDGISVEPTTDFAVSIISRNTDAESDVSSDEGAAETHEGDENADQATTATKPGSRLDPK